MKNLVFVVCVALTGGAAAAQSDAQGRYQQERQRCMDMSPAEDRETCLREAAAALKESRAARSRGAEPLPDFEANARRRCERLPEEHRRACEARMRGEGTTSGSVEAGGIYRELIIRERSD